MIGSAAGARTLPLPATGRTSGIALALASMSTIQRAPRCRSRCSTDSARYILLTKRVGARWGGEGLSVSQLREHRAAGRLDVDELEQRSGVAYAARTHGELADLPDQPGRGRSAPRRRPGHEWGGFLQVNFLLIAIWALSGAGYFWPAWVIVWWGLALALRSGPRLLRLGQ